MRTDNATFDLCELVTVAVRQVAPLAQAKGVSFSFECRGAEPVLFGDAVALECALHRVLCGAVDLLHDGFLVFDVQVDSLRAGSHTLRLTAGGAGTVAPDAEIDAVLERLQMRPIDASLGGDAATRRAVGRCPRTDADVVFACVRGDGLMWSFELELEGPVVAPEPERVDALQARAWVIDPDASGAQSLARRLQRLGWAITTMASTAEARQRLSDMAPALARPALVVATEGADVTAAGLEALVPLLPHGARCVLASAFGSATLAGGDSLPAIDIALRPLSPGDLRGWTQRLAPMADAPSGLTRPTPLLMRDRRLLLVVDDNDVNRIVACALAESLGYETMTARDGLESIDACSERPPDIVLMDLSMPRMDGFEAAQRLRALQRSGGIPPFRIVAATANAGEDTQRRCAEAGMDGLLHKPLLLDALRRELRRVDVARASV